MDFRKTVRRRSLNAAEETQPSRSTPAPAPGAERKAKRYTWAYNTAQIPGHAAFEEAHEEQVASDARSLEPAESTSSTSLRLPTLRALSEPSSEHTIRPRSAGSVLDSRVSSGKAQLQQPATLAPIMERRYVQISTEGQGRSATPKVKRWDARSRTTSFWDGLRKDSELFSQRANCSIHFYDKGQSRRGPSLKIPLERIYSARFASLFILVQTEFAQGDFHYDHMHRQCDLYIPAPNEASRKDAFTWHITTRNFFAFILGRPVVGLTLGQTLIDLRERLDVFRPNDPRNHEDLMLYLERLGYLDFSHCPSYAIALLHFAEHYELQNLWVDAFVHCVGMESKMNGNEEFQRVSHITKALITRAYLEMDLHLGRVTRALSNFLEEDFSPSNFGVSTGARAHLDRFRSFLHEYYVGKFGYWPPPKGSQFSKSLYKSMYFDFRGLYDYLVDLDSTDSLAHQKPASGGICVLQNVKAFDDRHNYMPLPHPHPMLPQELPPGQRPAVMQGTLKLTLSLTSKVDPKAEAAWARDALAAATNNVSVINAPLVRAYQRFEREYIGKPDDKLAINDARKVRWLLIYGTLQMLISVIRAPKEVRMTETNYPLCCLVTDTPPWKAGAKALTSPHTASILPPTKNAKHLDTFTATSVQPDCENDDYLTAKAASNQSDLGRGRRLSSLSMKSDISTNSLSRTGLLRSASIRSVKTITSSIGSIKAHRSLSKRRNKGVTESQSLPAPEAPPPTKTTTPSKPTANFCEIVVHAYGNGLNGSVIHDVPRRALAVELSADNLPEIVVSPQSPPPSPLWKENKPASPSTTRLSGSRLNERMHDLELSISTAKGEERKIIATIPNRQPLMEPFDHALPALEETSDAVSTGSSTSGPPPNLVWTSSRSSSPHSSASSQVAPDAAIPIIKDALHRDSPVSPTFSDASLMTPASLSPTSALHAFPGVMSPTLSSKKSMDLPMVVDVEEMTVYQPTGVPSAAGSETGGEGDDDEEEFPDRDASSRWSVASKTRTTIVTVPAPLKSSLRRTRTAASQVAKRRSVRIKEEPLEWVSRFRGSVAVAS